jgi:acetylornithine/N-succinyldiaminopimelate aminotransferase
MSALMSTYARADIEIVRGEGAYLYDKSGGDFLDLASGIAVNALGHGDGRLIAALSDQAARLWHASNLYRIPQQEQLAEALCAHTFADRVFFANSGAEAMECAIKTAKRWHHAAGRLSATASSPSRTVSTVAPSRRFPRPINPRSGTGSNPCSTGSIPSPSTIWLRSSGR